MVCGKIGPYSMKEVLERETGDFDPDFNKEIITGRLPFAGYPYFHFENGLRPDDLGDGVIEFSDGTIAVFDVSLGAHVFGEFAGERVVVNELFVAATLKEYLKGKFFEELSTQEIAELFAKFLEEKVIKQDLTDLALSVTVCRIVDTSRIIEVAGFGSNQVFGPNGRKLIKSKRAYDPYRPEEIKSRDATRELEIQMAEIPAGHPIVMATDGFDINFWHRRLLGRKGYPFEELRDLKFLSGEALVVRVGGGKA